MDNNFQTSFIPKKALSEERIATPGRTSLFSFIATLIFFGALASAAGMYFYKASIQKNITAMKASLEAAKNSLEPTRINDLKALDRRLSNANALLANHVAVTPIFKALEESTLKTIQYTKFSYKTPDSSQGAVQVQISGRARDYTSIALESDSLVQNKNIQDPIFSNLTLDNLTGTVTFELVFNLVPDFVHYVNNLPIAGAGNASSTLPTDSGFTQTPTDQGTIPTPTTPLAPETPTRKIP